MLCRLGDSLSVTPGVHNVEPAGDMHTSSCARLLILAVRGVGNVAFAQHFRFSAREHLTVLFR